MPLQRSNLSGWWILVMLLVELKRGRLMAWQLGVSFYSFGGDRAAEQP